MKKIGLALIAITITLSGCGNSQILGGNRTPDELSVVDAPPLSLPPDFELRPPREVKKEYEDRKKQETKNLILENDGSAKKASKSAVDSWLVEKAGGENRDPNIREKLTEDNQGQAEEEKKGWFSGWFGSDEEKNDAE